MTNNFQFSAIFLLLTSFIIQESNAASSYSTFDVINFGAKPDGRTDSTQPFLRAWSLACSSIRPAIVSVPRGSFLVTSVAFSGPCKNKVTLNIVGTILAPMEYWKLGNSGYWILFYKVNRLTINGGTLDARGAAFWACPKTHKTCPPGARSISFVRCGNLVVSGLRSINSQLFHIAIDESNDILLQNLRIMAPSWSPNTDGVHTQASTGITIQRSIISTGDDCISLGPGSRNTWIERIACGPGHGISIGSLGSSRYEDGVENVTVIGSVFSRTQNGVRIKSWARPSNGFVRDIQFRNLIMNFVDNPIIIDQNYCPHGSKTCPNQSSGVKIRGVTYKNIKGTSGTNVAINLGCSSANPCQGIKLQDIKLTYRYGAPRSYCANAHGTSSGFVIPASCLSR
ncbi:polygalacturonase-like [Tripterygium wilfordii]|uniref:polygalacturonase-like n=1 Tax=Tripterygium wilfordii TaxID=458696 RepID=UPI0018F7E564|nr:polygalacturonase-like [Tripterygium wilfordii]